MAEGSKRSEGPTLRGTGAHGYMVHELSGRGSSADELQDTWDAQ